MNKTIHLLQSVPSICNDYSDMDNNTIPDANNPNPPPIPPTTMSVPQPQPISETPQAPLAQTIVATPPETPKRSSFTVFLIAAIAFLFVIWGVVGYLYFSNKKGDGTAEEVAKTETPTPPIQVLASEIQISNGSIVQISGGGETKILVPKESYPGSGIIGFSHVAVSADSQKMCFESIPPALEPAVYVSNIDGTNVIEVAKNRKSCTWGAASDTIFYVDDSRVGNTVDIYSYDVNTKLEKNLTTDTQTQTEHRQYEIMSLLENKLACKYSVVEATGKKLSESNCEIDLSTGSVTQISETQE